MSARLARYLGWAATCSGFTAIIALVSLLLFFGLETSTRCAQSSHFWGPISDIAPIFQMLSLSIVAYAIFILMRSGAPRLSLFCSGIGITGIAGVVLLQILLRLNILSFEQEVKPVLFATALVGVWLVLISILGQRQGNLPARLAWLGIAVGAAFILEPIIFTMAGGAMVWRVFMSNYLLLAISVVVFLVSYIGFPIWAFWLGRIFLKTNAPVLKPGDVYSMIEK